MKINDVLHLVAGAFIMASVGLGYFVHPWWFAFTFFVGANLFQSGLTKWCPLAVILRKLGMPE